MARYPIHQTRTGDAPRDRDALWTEIRRRRRFTKRDLVLDSDMDQRSVQQFLSGLTRAGILVRDGNRYELVRDVGFETPRLRSDGSPVPPTKSEKIWRALKILGEFNADELVIACSDEHDRVSRAYVLDYVKNLNHAGYLHVTRHARPVPARPGHVHRAAPAHGPAAEPGVRPESQPRDLATVGR